MMEEKRREVIDVKKELQNTPSPRIDWKLYDKYVDHMERIVQGCDDEEYALRGTPDFMYYKMVCKNGTPILSKLFTVGEEHEAKQLQNALEECLYILKCCLRYVEREMTRITGEFFNDSPH